MNKNINYDKCIIISVRENHKKIHEQKFNMKEIEPLSDNSIEAIGMMANRKGMFLALVSKDVKDMFQNKV